jgi:RNA polymerase subunit RPABC4/transcription elongation factor Spt4
MALIFCKDCKKEFSSDATKCPHCSARKPRGAADKFIRWVGGALVVIFLIGFMSNPNPTGSVSPAPAVQRTPVNNWIVERSKSKMDDSDGITLITESTQPISGWLNETMPKLVVLCQERKLSVMVDMGTRVHPDLDNYEKSYVRLRIDKDKPTNENWRQTTDHKILFAPKPKLLISQLANAETFIFQFTPLNSGTASAVFNVQGLNIHLQDFRANCKL